MPALFGAIVVMVIYGIFAGDMAQTLRFLLEPDFSKITAGTAALIDRIIPIIGRERNPLAVFCFGS